MKNEEKTPVAVTPPEAAPSSEAAAPSEAAPPEAAPSSEAAAPPEAAPPTEAVTEGKAVGKEPEEKTPVAAPPPPETAPPSPETAPPPPEAAPSSEAAAPPTEAAPSTEAVAPPTAAAPPEAAPSPKPVKKEKTEGKKPEAAAPPVEKKPEEKKIKRKPSRRDIEQKKKEKKKMPLLWRLLILFVIIVLIPAGLILYNELLPPIRLVGDEEVTIQVGDEYKDEGIEPGFAKSYGNVNTKQGGDYTITYKRGKNSVTRTVHVIDPAADAEDVRAVIGLKGSAVTLVKEGDPYIESGAYLIDKENGAVDFSSIQVQSNVDTSTPGTYTVTYTGDLGDVRKTAERTVKVVPADEFESNTSGIPVLMYHYIYTAEDVPSPLNVNYTIDTKFAEQLQYLKENEYYYPSFSELRAYVEGKIELPAKSVILTFDDAEEGFLKYGIPLLEQYQVPGVSFVIGTEGGAEKVSTYASRYVQFQSHSYDMHKAGGNIGHGGIISALSEAQIIEDLQTSFAEVGSTQAFAYPYGDVTETAKQAVASAGVECAFTTAFGKVKKGDDCRALSRVRVSGDQSLESYAAQLG